MELSFPEGEIFRDNDDTDGLYIIKTGMVKVTKSAADSAGVEAVLDILRPGNSFGELSLIDGLPRSAKVVAMSPTVCCFLPRDAFIPVLKGNLKIAYAMLPALASIVRSSDQWVAQLIRVVLETYCGQSRQPDKNSSENGGLLLSGRPVGDLTSP